VDELDMSFILFVLLLLLFLLIMLLLLLLLLLLLQDATTPAMCTAGPTPSGI